MTAWLLHVKRFFRLVLFWISLWIFFFISAVFFDTTTDLLFSSLHLFLLNSKSHVFSYSLPYSFMGTSNHQCRTFDALRFPSFPLILFPLFVANCSSFLLLAAFLFHSAF